MTYDVCPFGEGHIGQLAVSGATYLELASAETSVVGTVLLTSKVAHR